MVIGHVAAASDQSFTNVPATCAARMFLHGTFYQAARVTRAMSRVPDLDDMTCTTLTRILRDSVYSVMCAASSELSCESLIGARDDDDDDRVA